MSDSPDRRRVYGSRRWRIVRRRVLERAGWRCETCGKAGRLEVHHVDPMWQSSGNPFDPDRLKVLCRACHFNAHGNRARPAPGPIKGLAEWQAWIGKG